MQYPLLTKLLICTSLFMYSAIASAEIYRWLDENGRVQFSDQQPLSQQAETLDLPELTTYKGVTVSKLEDDIEAPVEEKKKTSRRKRVIIYSAEWCGVCSKAKNYFKKKKIPFKERDIDKSKKARKAFDKLNATGIPVILIGKTRMNGFSVGRFEKIYY